MKTYTFKIKVDTDKVVAACHMQLEQFFDSVKMSGMELLVERYPETYITACDYYWEDKDNEKHFTSCDFSLSTLKNLLDSKDLKAFFLSAGFCGFVGDSDFKDQLAHDIMISATDFIINEKKVLEEEVNDDELSETTQE